MRFRAAPKLALFLLAIAVTLLMLAGCNGGGGHAKAPPPQTTVTTVTIPVQPPTPFAAVHPCTPNDYYMQCALPKPPLRLGFMPPSVAFGIDFAWGCPSPGSLSAVGASFGASYYSYDTSKNWTLGCVNWYHQNGKSTVGVWETGAGRATSGYSAGQDDAKSAVWQANAVGNHDRAIYFAVDCDCSGGSVASYFDGVKSIIGFNRTGAYAGYYPISYLFNTGRIKWGWQTYAWSGGLWDSRAQLEQYSNDHVVGGVGVDYDRAVAKDYGQSPAPGPPPPPPDPHLYLIHPASASWLPGGRRGGPFLSPFGKLDERLAVLRYDGARAHPTKYAGLLKYTLEPRLRYLAERLWWLECHDKNLGEFPLPCTWNQNDSGPRYGGLRQRADGKLVAK